MKWTDNRQGPDHARTCRLKEGVFFFLSLVGNDMVQFASLRDASGGSVGMGWTEVSAGGDIPSDCTGKGRTMERVKRSEVPWVREVDGMNRWSTEDFLAW